MSIYDREWYWQDRARKERQYYNPRKFRSQGLGGAAYGKPLWRRTSAVSFPVGIACVLLLAWLFSVQVAQWRAEAAAKHILHSAQEAAAQLQAQVLRAQQEAAARQASRKADLRHREALRLQAIGEYRRAEDEQLRATRTKAERKEHAWARFYRRPPMCEAAATIECANDYIRAKRTFEERYARNQL
jgi:hypothetical protein